MFAKPADPGVFVTGTDTGVGKTYHSVRLIQHLRRLGWNVGAYKPVASGMTDGDCHSDPHLLWNAIGRRETLERVCPQRFRAPLSPPEAASREGRSVDQKLLVEGARWWRDQCDFLVVEGAGGILSPVSRSWTCADLARALCLPILLVVPNRLGAVNQALTAAEVILRRELRFHGILLNSLPDHDPSDSSVHSNAQWISRFLTGVPLYRTVEQWAESVEG